MNDTSPAVSAVYRRMLMSRSGAERLEMGGAMFDAARVLVRAGLRDSMGSEGSPLETRLCLIQRTYGGEIEACVLDRIAELMRDREATTH